MSPFLVFLNAARNLASMGMKREQVLDFAQREFGELTELMKAQIDNIYKPKKGAPSESKIGEFMGFKNYPKKDEVFDDTVVKMKFDDEGKPFNPKDPLKNLSKKDKKADGGRIGLFKGAVASGEDISPGTDVGGNVRDDNPFSGGDGGGGGGDNFVDTTTKKKIIEGGKTATKNIITNKVFDKFGKVIGLNPKAAALLGIINVIRGSKKIDDPLMEDQEGMPALANGGRIGLKEGVTKDGIFPMKRDGFLISPDFDNMTEEQKMYMEGMKIQEKMRQKKLREFLDKLLESQPESERGLKPVPMPDRALPKTGIQSLAGGGRVGFKKGLLASMMEGLSPDGGIFQSIFANRKHPILSTFNATELLSIGEALGPLIGFNQGGRVGLKDGMNRRKFLKIMGGLASLPIVGKFLKFAKPAAPAAQKVMENFSTKVSEAPTYFFDLITKIKAFGKKSKLGPSERVDEYTYIGKNGDEYTLTEDIVTGDAQIVKDKMGVGSSGDKTFDTINDRSVMEYKAPRKDADPDTRQVIDEGAEYEEYKIEFDMDGTQAGADAIDETIQKEIIEEAKKSAPPIKKAAGGLAYMLGE